MDKAPHQDLTTRLADAEGALTELVYAHDAPDNVGRRARLAAAWARARTLVSQIPYYCIECDTFCTDDPKT
jgi:hypothetical protein